MGFQALFKFVKCWRAPDVVEEILSFAFVLCLLMIVCPLHLIRN